MLVAACNYTPALSILPGPANFLAPDSGVVRQGARQSVSVILGVATGPGALVLVSRLDRLKLLSTSLIFTPVLRATCLAFIACLARKILTSACSSASFADGKTREVATYPNGRFLSLLNTTAGVIAFCALASTNTSLGAGDQLIVLIALILFVINSPCIMVWSSFAEFFSRLLTNSRRDPALKLTMDGLLLSAFPAANRLLSISP